MRGNLCRWCECVTLVVDEKRSGLDLPISIILPPNTLVSRVKTAWETMRGFAKLQGLAAGSDGGQRHVPNDCGKSPWKCALPGGQAMRKRQPK